MQLVTVPARWESAAVFPRAVAHAIDLLVVLGFSTYVAKLFSLLLVAFHMSEIKVAGKFAGRLFRDVFSYGQGQLMFVAFVTLACVYFVGFGRWQGRTPGMGLLGLRFEDERGLRPGVRALFLRLLGCGVIYMTGGIFWLQSLKGLDRPILHDTMSGTRVVKS